MPPPCPHPAPSHPCFILPVLHLLLSAGSRTNAVTLVASSRTSLAQLSRLCSLGYDAAEATQALEGCSGDADRALLQLYQQLTGEQGGGMRQQLS